MNYSYFKDPNLTLSLLLGLCLSFWDMNSTEVVVGQHYGLSLPPCPLATSAPGDTPITHLVLCQQSTPGTAQ